MICEASFEHVICFKRQNITSGAGRIRKGKPKMSINEVPTSLNLIWQSLNIRIQCLCTALFLPFLSRKQLLLAGSKIVRIIINKSQTPGLRHLIPHAVSSHSQFDCCNQRWRALGHTRQVDRGKFSGHKIGPSAPGQQTRRLRSQSLFLPGPPRIIKKESVLNSGYCELYKWSFLFLFER